MWTNQGCILTTKDFTILEILQERRGGLGEPMMALLRHKLDSATVVFRDDVPADVATLNSRVRFRIGETAPETRIISHDQMQGMVGLTLPLTTLRGLALLGLAGGESIVLPRDGENAPHRIILETVLYQPEAARQRNAEHARRRPPLRLVHDAGALVTTIGAETGDDDPGPSAA
ncbi:nucleoside-diphosphate kinase [Nitratireductor pacificus]|uniref:GreA/GreB family elongation factor n=1 Tax=Nitratireductor pacificus pht-3B TaxID=391937 RepID=K2M5L0_9HYPH|nr:nucleoside-diphosphate kinase [Nitratireductor pacificus]EKF17431.1 GreA/GreB family elongation factor [Nitratireductor pacificus pht-3B]